MIRTAIVVIYSMGLVMLVTACGKKPSAQPISSEQIPQVLNDAFKQAQPEASAAAQEVIASAQVGDPSVLQQAQELGARPDLTEDQRRAAYRASEALRRKMIEDAARGDQKAQEALKAYRANK